MKAVQVALAIGIAILLPILAEMTVRIYAQPPEYDYEYYPPQPRTADERAAANKEAKARQDAQDKRRAAYNLQVFLVTFPLGVLEIVDAFLLRRRRPTLAAGVMFGGIFTVAFGSFSSWETLPGWCRYVSLVFVLALLGWLAISIDRDSKPVAE